MIRHSEQLILHSETYLASVAIFFLSKKRKANALGLASRSNTFLEIGKVHTRTHTHKPTHTHPHNTHTHTQHTHNTLSLSLSLSHTHTHTQGRECHVTKTSVDEKSKGFEDIAASTRARCTLHLLTGSHLTRNDYCHDTLLPRLP